MVIEITKRNFDKEVLECKLAVFACFTTEWCHSCYPMCLFADKLSQEYDGCIKFFRLDTEKNPEIAEKYHVIAVPNIFIFQNAQPVMKLPGFQNQSSIRKALNSVINRNEMIGAV